HMPRGLIGSIAEMRVTISRAALLVKVTASTDAGLAWPVDTSQAMRVVSTRVFPLPAPARISACSAGRVTAASCCGFRWARRSGMAPFYRRPSTGYRRPAKAAFLRAPLRPGPAPAGGRPGPAQAPELLLGVAPHAPARHRHPVARMLHARAPGGLVAVDAAA